MTEEHRVVAFDVRMVNVVAYAHRHRRHGCGEGVGGRLELDLQQQVRQLLKAPDAYHLSSATVDRLRRLRDGLDGATPGSGAARLGDDGRAVVLEVLEDVVRRMHPGPTGVLRRDIAHFARNGQGVGWSLLRRLLWLERLDPGLLAGLTEEDLMPLLTHESREIRQRAITVVGRLPGRPASDPPEPSTPERGHRP